MTPKQAWIYAATWGSFMRAGDPGACMYGFDERCLPQSEEHRASVLAYVEGCKANVTASPADYDRNEAGKLDEFGSYIRRAAIDGEVKTTFTTEEGLAEFIDGMVNAALFSTTAHLPDGDEDDDSSFMDLNYTAADIAPDTMEMFRSDAADFIKVALPFITDAHFTGRKGGSIWSRAGHDFWMTRAGHGCGFWDGDWTAEASDVMTPAAKAAGEVDLYMADIGDHEGMISH